MHPRAKICGIGAVTSYGWGASQLWSGLLSGRSAARYLPGYGAAESDPGWVATIPEGGGESDVGSLFTRAMRAAAREAILDAGERGWAPGRRVGVVHGSALGDVGETDRFYREFDGHFAQRPRWLRLMESTPITKIMQEWDFHGPVMKVGAMCGTGNAAIITAKMWLDSGYADDVVVITTDLSATRPIVRQFVDLDVAIVDTEPLKACRPFQAGSRGFTFAEGAVAMVLSSHAQKPYAEVLGGAMTNDAFHAISLEPTGMQLQTAVIDALDRADVEADAVRYVNAHGPGTRQCDQAEAEMLEAIFPASTQIYSVKPLVGHCQSSAATIEVAAACLAWKKNWIPAPVPVAEGHGQLLPGPEIPADGLVVKTSLGMGGQNSAIVLAASE